MSRRILPGGRDGKECPCNWESLIPGLWRSPGEGNGNPLQCYCLENTHRPCLTVHGVTVRHASGSKQSMVITTVQLSSSIHEIFQARTLEWVSLAIVSSKILRNKSCSARVIPWTVPTRLLCPLDSPGRNTGVVEKKPLSKQRYFGPKYWNLA